jgi:HTH-type transcriptional regulator, transcriptional repressor of NAD biosynthesis genes
VNKRFRCGLVVGKFSPLHRGHELLIQRALAECEEVIALSYSKPELPGCEAVQRDEWFEALFPQVRHWALNDERLGQWVKPGAGLREVPDNNAEERAHRRFCAFFCCQVAGVTVDAVFTSEDYGDGFAAELTRYGRELRATYPSVEHVLVDRERRQVSASGSQLRQDIHGQRAWLSPKVYASFVQRVCLLGGESSGKSTLAEALAAEFETTFVSEYGRELWEKKGGRLDFADMHPIAEVQIQREMDARQHANRFLFCDTSPLTTLFYSRHLFGKAEPELERLAQRRYDLTVLCAPDYAFVQDGTRQSESFRAEQHEWYLTELSKRGFYLLVTGPIPTRVLQVRHALSALR